jgi:hypothetical protein
VAVFFGPRAVLSRTVVACTCSKVWRRFCWGVTSLGYWRCHCWLQGLLLLWVQQEHNMQSRSIRACRNVPTALSQILTHFVSTKPTSKGNVLESMNLYFCCYVLLRIMLWLHVGLRPLACWDCGFESNRGAWKSVCFQCCVSGRGLCDELITRS